jgi:hypothetical protein
MERKVTELFTLSANTSPPAEPAQPAKPRRPRRHPVAPAHEGVGTARPHNPSQPSPLPLDQSQSNLIDLSGERRVRAAQCKKHDAWTAIDAQEIKDEVAKAELARPVLNLYYIMTTAKTSTQAQDAVKDVNSIHAAKGLFTVELFTWDKIEDLLEQHQDVRAEFYDAISGQMSHKFAAKLDMLLDLVMNRYHGHDRRPLLLDVVLNGAECVLDHPPMSHNVLRSAYRASHPCGQDDLSLTANPILLTIQAVVSLAA